MFLVFPDDCPKVPVFDACGIGLHAGPCGGARACGPPPAESDGRNGHCQFDWYRTYWKGFTALFTELLTLIALHILEYGS